MAALNEPNYPAIQAKVLRCLHAWCRDATEADEKVALDYLDEIWPEVKCSRGSNIIAAFQAAARYAISQKEVVEESAVAVKAPKKRGRPPKNKSIEAERDPEPTVKTAFVDESIKLD